MPPYIIITKDNNIIIYIVCPLGKLQKMIILLPNTVTRVLVTQQQKKKHLKLGCTIAVSACFCMTCTYLII